jgi:type IV fimbrial biogenesis protein FimT
MTLIEALVGVAISVVLLGMAAPYLGDFSQAARLRQSGDALLAEALYAQSEAIKRNSTVRLHVAASVVQVRDMSSGGTGTLLRERVLLDGIGIGDATADVDFGSRGTPLPWGTGASVDLAKSGLTCSADLRCPGLRIDGGGGIRLCANQLSCT